MQAPNVLQYAMISTSVQKCVFGGNIGRDLSECQQIIAMLAEFGAKFDVI